MHKRYKHIITYIIPVVLIVLLTGNLTAQNSGWMNKKVTADFTDEPLGSVLLTVAEKAGLSIAFADELVEGRNITANFESKPFKDILDDLLKDIPVQYNPISNDYIVLTLLEKPEEVLKPKTEVTVDQLNGVISGRVTDAKTGDPLIGANVYFNNTMIGTATDSNGFFVLYNLKRGVYRLVISYVGYEMFQENIRVKKGDVIRKNVKLKTRLASTDEVVVTDLMPKDWKRHLKIFEREFLGETDNAKKCSLINPEVLDFFYDDASETLRARSQEPLIVENRGLGYRLYVTVADFKHNKKMIRYRAPIRFEYLKPKNAKQSARWKQARLEAYKGSKRHFLRTLVTGYTELEGFIVEEKTSMDNSEPDEESIIALSSIAMPGRFNDEHVLSFRNYLRITYLPDKEERTVYLGSIYDGEKIFRREQEFPASWLTIEESPVYFNDNGEVYDSYKLVTYGVWGQDRLAEVLPVEYRPPDDRLAVKIR